MNKSFVFITLSALVLGACVANPDGTGDNTTTTTTTSTGGQGGSGGAGGSGGTVEVNELRWTPPHGGYIQVGEVVAVAFTESGSLLKWELTDPLCQLTEQDDGSYVCPLVVNGADILPSGEDVYYTIFHADASCAPGGWIFDQGNYTCGACDGLSQCCGNSFGIASITLHSVKLPQVPVLNGTAPCVFNMKVHTPPQ